MSMSLPTPPRTTHKDKENQPPTPLTPSNSKFRSPRIVWSQENLHHAYTTQIRELPSSGSAQGPHKSILKKPSRPLMSLMPPEQPAREVTPEPADPLHHPLYLNSPVSTLVASLRPGMDAKLTLTDLTEAYSILSVRLKTKTHAMLDMCGPIPALEPLREHTAELVQAFHRDIGRAFVDPQSTGTPPPSNNTPWSTPSSVGSVKKRGFTEQEVKHARDLCNLSHAAMRCFSNISVVPVLCSIFTDAQLGDLLTDLLAIPLASSIPTPNARKTCQIAVWTLQIQRLPTAVLTPAADRIVYALRRGIDGELGREGKKGAASDGLKGVATLVSYQPAVFLPPFVEILPSILANLTSQNLTLRAQAALAILSLSHALASLSAPSSTLLASLSQITTGYLSEQHTARKSPQDLSPLGKAFSVCLNAEVPTHSAQSPMWALSVIAAFIVLSGGDTLTHSRTIKFVLGHLQTAMAIKRTTVRATAGLVWRALVWACVQLDSGVENQGKRDAGWRVVRQIVDGAIGISVVAALVGQRATREERVREALEVVSLMIKKGGKTCEEAVDILERLLCGVGSGIEEQKTNTWTNNRLLVEPLFDGTLLQVEWKGLAAHVKDGLNTSVTVRDVRQLQEHEVAQHWDMLFTIWKEAVERAPLGEDGEVPAPLLSAWQALLLTQAQLTQGYEHLTSEPAFISQLADLLKSFLSDQSLEWSLDAGAPSWSSQPLKLGFVRNLWTVARNIFAMPTLAGAAELLLYEVLRHDYRLEQNEVRDAWATLCAELVLAGIPRLVRELWEDNEQGRSLESGLKRGLWMAVSQQWVEQAGSWDGAIELLRAPFALPIEWEFDRDDLDLWVRLVECSLIAAEARKVSPNTVLDAIAHEIGAGHNPTSLYAVLPFLLSGVDVSVPQLPFVLLKLTNDVLLASYQSVDTGTKPMLLAVVDSLTYIIKTVDKELLVETLTAVQDGISRWIEDEKHVFTDQEFNQQVIPFYVASLEALKAIPPSSRTLHALTNLLISAFGQIPEPALGPSAFKSFWVDTYLLLEQSELDYPEDLKPVLRNIQEVMCEPGETFAPGLSQETQTEALGTADVVLSIVPDSLEASNHVLHVAPKSPVLSIVELLLEVSEEPATDRQSLSPEIHCSNDPPVQEDEVNPDSLVCPSSPYATPKQEVIDDDTRSVSFEKTSRSEGLLVPQSPAPASAQHQLDHEVSLDLASKPTSVNISEHFTPRNSPSVKKESLDLGPDVALPKGSSQIANSSQSSRSSGSSLGKRRRSRLFSLSSKKRKAGPSADVEIINVSDDEDSEQVALDQSIVVSRPKRVRSSHDQAPGSQQAGESSTPIPIKPTTPQSSGRNNKKRSLFEAVEIPKVDGFKIQRYATLAHPSDVSPYKRKKLTSRVHSDSYMHHQLDEDGVVEKPPSPLKRRRINELLLKKEVANDWSDISPRRVNRESASDDNETPLRPSDTSVPSSQPGQISAHHIISPLPRRSRSEAYDPPSDDIPMSSSPLKHVAARRLLHRARTVPAILTTDYGDLFNSPSRPVPSRVSSEEFLALEHAHVIVTSRASKMGLQELLEASRMADGISVALSDQVSKKFNSSQDAGPA